jgi:hypothetical protein
MRVGDICGAGFPACRGVGSCPRAWGIFVGQAFQPAGASVPAHARGRYLWGRLSSLPGRRVPPTRMGDILIRESIGIVGEINIAGDM